MSGQEKPPKRTPPPRYVPFLSRTQGMGSTGWEATTIGFTLVGCILAGVGLGWLLDRHFGTSYWLPVFFLVGVVAGFREMMLTLNRISKNEAQRRKAKSESETANRYTPASPEAQATPAKAARERIFTVPPPPFESGGTERADTTPVGKAKPETTEAMIARLLEAADDEENRQELGPLK